MKLTRSLTRSLSGRGFAGSGEEPAARPVLTLPTGEAVGSYAASGTVVTDTDSGTLWVYFSNSPTEVGPVVKALAQDVNAVSVDGEQSVAGSGLAAGQLYYAHYVQRANGRDSFVVSSAGFMTEVVADTTAPVLSSPTAAETGETTATGTVITVNDANGVLYGCVSTTSSPLSAQDIIDEVAVGGVSYANAAVTTTGLQTLNFIGLDPESTYYIHYIHEDSAGNRSNQAISTGFTTDSSEAPGTASLLIQFEDATEGAYPHRIYSDPVGDETQPIELAAGDSEHELTGLDWNTEHEITIKVWADPDEVSPLTATLWTSPELPPGLSAAASGENSITLTLTAPADPPGSPYTGSGYRIEQSPNGTTGWSQVGDIVLTEDVADEIEVSGLAGATEYFFRASSVNANPYPHDEGRSDYSTDSATTDTDLAAPTLTSATIAANGTTLTTVFSEPVVFGAGGDGGLNVDCSLAGANNVATYASGSGTNTLVWTLATQVEDDETCDLDYTQPGNGIEDGSGNDLATITSFSVTNNSTYVPVVATPFITTQTAGANRSDSLGWVGFEFSANTDITVTHLGRMYRTGNNESHDVGLFDNGGTLIEKVVVDFSTGSFTDGVTYYTALVTPRACGNTALFVCATKETGSDTYGDLHTEAAIVAISDSFHQCYRVGSGESGAFTTGGTSGASYGNPNLKFTNP